MITYAGRALLILVGSSFHRETRPSVRPSPTPARAHRTASDHQDLLDLRYRCKHGLVDMVLSEVIFDSMMMMMKVVFFFLFGKRGRAGIFKDEGV